MTGRTCAAHLTHLPSVPIEAHRLRPVTRGGEVSPVVPLCPTAHRQVHALLDAIEEAAIRSPFSTTREVIRYLPPSLWASYPGEVRVVAYHGWLTYGLGFINGMYAQRYRHWTTAGEPRAPEVPAYADLAHAARWSRRWRRELLGTEKAPGRNRGRWSGSRQTGTAARLRE